MAKVRCNAYLVDIFSFALTEPRTISALNKKYDESATYFNQIKSREAWPEAKLLSVLGDFQKLHPNVRRADVEGSDVHGIIDRMSLDDHELRALISHLHLEVPEPNAFVQRLLGARAGKHLGRVTRAPGHYVNVYICKERQGSGPAVAQDHFTFGDGAPQPNQAFVRQANYDGAGVTEARKTPSGLLQIIHDSVLAIDIDYHDKAWPKAHYLGHLPMTSVANFVIMVSLDVKASARTVMARPSLLVRMDRLPPSETPVVLPQSSDLYRTARAFFSSIKTFDTDVLLELNPPHGVESNVMAGAEAVKAALAAL